jgi:hypothetical protein
MAVSLVNLRNSAHVITLCEALSYWVIKVLRPMKKPLDWIVDTGISGAIALPSASQLANNYLKASGNAEEAIDSIIAWRTIHACSTGFITGLGGIASLPVSIPLDLITSYILAANTVAAIAYLRGYDTSFEQVKVFILLCLIGEAGEKVLKDLGIAISTKVCENLIRQIPRKLITEINKRVGFRLLSKTGEKSSITLMKIVPLAGGVVGASLNGIYINRCGYCAKKYFVAQEVETRRFSGYFTRKNVRKIS